VQLDPKVLMTIKNLSLLAKTVVDGFMIGLNKSTVKGPGLEFSQYRSYQPGDDLRWLDWKCMRDQTGTTFASRKSKQTYR